MDFFKINASEQQTFTIKMINNKNCVNGRQIIVGDNEFISLGKNNALMCPALVKIHEKILVPVFYFIMIIFNDFTAALKMSPIFISELWSP